MNTLRRYTELVEQVARDKSAVETHERKLESAISEVAEAYPDADVKSIEDIEALHAEACATVERIERKIAEVLDKIEEKLPK